MSCLIPVDVWKKAMGMVPKNGGKPVDGCLHFDEASLKDEQHRVSIHAEGLTWEAKFQPMDGMFPKGISEQIPQDADSGTNSVWFNPAIMADALAVLAHAFDGNHYSKLQLTTAKAPMRFTMTTQVCDGSCLAQVSVVSMPINMEK